MGFSCSSDYTIFLCSDLGPVPWRLDTRGFTGDFTLSLNSYHIIYSIPIFTIYSLVVKVYGITLVYCLQFLKKMLLDRQQSMSSLFAMGSEVAAGADPTERKAIERQLKDLMTRFDNLTEGAEQRYEALIQAMGVAKQFQVFTAQSR